MNLLLLFNFIDSLYLVIDIDQHSIIRFLLRFLCLLTRVVNFAVLCMIWCEYTYILSGLLHTVLSMLAGDFTINVHLLIRMCLRL